jgi:hypothetical protein
MGQDFCSEDSVSEVIGDAEDADGCVCDKKTYRLANCRPERQYL